MLGDSHVSMMDRFNASYGINSISVAGAGLVTLDAFLEKEQIFNRNVSALFLLCGGNDLAKHKSPEWVVTVLKEIVEKIEKSNPKCLVVSGTIIPRQTDKLTGNTFVEKVEEVDKMVEKYANGHHHFVTDLLVGEPSQKTGEVGPRHPYFERDKVHLSGVGREEFRKLLAFVYDSVNLNRYGDRVELVQGRGFRSAFWKF